LPPTFGKIFQNDGKFFEKNRNPWKKMEIFQIFSKSSKPINLFMQNDLQNNLRISAQISHLPNIVHKSLFYVPSGIAKTKDLRIPLISCFSHTLNCFFSPYLLYLT
jgi:hypothetical protein